MKCQGLGVFKGLVLASLGVVLAPSCPSQVTLEMDSELLCMILHRSPRRPFQMRVRNASQRNEKCSVLSRRVVTTALYHDCKRIFLANFDLHAGPTEMRRAVPLLILDHSISMCNGWLRTHTRSRSCARCVWPFWRHSSKACFKQNTR